jgi:hypothetical protein
MTTRRQPVSDSQIRRVLETAREFGIPVERCGLDVGPDYVRILPPSGEGGESVAQYVTRPAHRPQKTAGR